MSGQLATQDTCISRSDWTLMKESIVRVLDYNDLLISQHNTSIEIINNQKILITNQNATIKAYSNKTDAYDAQVTVLHKNNTILQKALEKEINNRWVYGGIGAGVVVILGLLLI